jgi:hypothetical protein
MSAIIQPISSDGGFVTAGNITVSTTTIPPASPAPYISGFSSATLTDFINVPNLVFNSNVYNVGGFTISTLADIGGQVDYNNRTVGYVADNNGSASLYARDSAGLGDNNAVITANATNGKITLLAANTALNNQTWTFDGAGNLTLPGNTFSVNYANGTQVSLGGGGGIGNLAASGNVIYAPGSPPSGFVNFDNSSAGMIVGTNTTMPVIINTDELANNNIWTFDVAGNLTLPTGGVIKYANGTQYGGGSYGDSNVATLLSSFGSNTVSTTGNVTVGNVVFGANTGQVAFHTGAYITGNANSISRDGSILLQPYTGAGSTFPGVVIGGAGRLIAPNGSVSQIFNTSDVTFQVATKVTVGTAATTPVAAALIVTGGIGASGTSTTGVGSLLTGPTFTPLSNTIAGFNSNVNSYTQVTFQNKSTGTDATADFVLTADNGNDTVNYGDFGIINSGYDNGTPTNSLGNIVYAADTYLYAQGNASATGQSGGNLAIGTTTVGKNVKIFAGGVDNTYIVANISNTGVAVTGNLSVSGNISGNTAGFAIGYRDVPQVAASNTTLAATDGGKHYYSTTAGNFTLTIPNNSTTSFATGTAISIVVQAAGNILVNAASGVTLYLAGNSTAANRVVGAYGMATLMKVASDTWFINGTGVS